MQQQQQNCNSISVAWRGKKFILEMNSSTTIKELGHQLQKLTNVKSDTMRLFVPQSLNKSPKLVLPFSDEYSALSLQEISYHKGKDIRMMGVPEAEVNEVLQNAKADLRIAGFEEEEKRMKQRMLDGPHFPLKLPQGTYIFCDFRTLNIPGVELNPPASEALKRMHMLAADPGIVAIMNKHHWRVGIMTEMAPVGYVGVSPKCILGFNKNHGEEISLRLRTDDLKGFRKYESIKKTLLHELAHMVYSEHDANFYALDKQLNQEAAALDWTRSTSHTLNGRKYSERYDEEFYVDRSSSSSHKLGGKTSDQLADACASSVAAAYHRIAAASVNSLTVPNNHEEPDPDDSGFDAISEPDHMDAVGGEKLNAENQTKTQFKPIEEPDPDDTEAAEAMESESYSESMENRIPSEPDPDDIEMTNFVPPLKIEQNLARSKTSEEPDPDDDSEAEQNKVGYENIVRPDQENQRKDYEEPDPDDDSEAEQNKVGYENIVRPDQESQRKDYEEPDPDDSQASNVVQAEPDPDDNLVAPEQGISGAQIDEPDPDDQELQRIQDPVTVVCSRLQKAIEMLRSELSPLEAAMVLQTLFKIIRNVIENPEETKFKRLRKANPIIKRNVANYKAAMEILFLIGFHEDVVLDNIGKAETYLILKRNDPGLLWLAKSSLETCIAC